MSLGAEALMSASGSRDGATHEWCVAAAPVGYSAVLRKAAMEYSPKLAKAIEVRSREILVTDMYGSLRAERNTERATDLNILGSGVYDFPDNGSCVT